MLFELCKYSGVGGEGGGEWYSEIVLLEFLVRLHEAILMHSLHVSCPVFHILGLLRLDNKTRG